jgi:hypothetical protein
LAPPDFRGLCFCDFCPQDRGHLLGTETDSKDWDISLHGFTEQFLLGAHGVGHVVPIGAPIGTQGQNQIEICHGQPFFVIFSQELCERITMSTQCSPDKTRVYIFSIRN